MDRAAWLAERRNGIGSSDAPAVCGLSRHGTAAKVYYSKKGIEFHDESPELEWGTRLEPAIAQKFSERHGVELLQPPPFTRHPTIPWAFANLDRITVDGEIVELKAAFTKEGWGPDGTDEIPDAYIVQVQHQMWCANRDQATVAALLMGCDFRVYTVKRNESLVRWMAEREAELWDRVQRSDPPPLDYAHPSTLDMLAEIHGYDAGERLLLPHELEQVAHDYLHAQEMLKCYEDVKRTTKARLLDYMGSAAEALLPNGVVLRRRLVNRAGYAVQPTSYVQFSVKPPKEIPLE